MHAAGYQGRIDQLDQRIAKSSLVQRQGRDTGPGMGSEDVHGSRRHRKYKPPDTISDFKAYQNDKDFRALMYCHLRVNR